MQLDTLSNVELIWVCIGFGGQALFTGRFVVQWFASEKQGESVIPVAFWYLSLLGGATLLSYAVFRRDPVIIVGQLFGVVVYVRNLALIHRKRESPQEAAGSQPRMDDQGRPATIPLRQTG